GWHPRMVDSHIEDGKDASTIGCVRNFQLASGARLREKLLDFSDDDFLVSYSILETPQPLTNHKATLQLRRVTDGDRTYAEWTASFDAAPEDADKLAEGMGANVFQGGFNALKTHFAGQS
ncbi:SRPBCC family protein, partial [Mesorhizobium sp. M8A.F.Ca.ET.023.01.1.1]